MSMFENRGSHTSVEVASTHMPKACTLGPATCMMEPHDSATGKSWLLQTKQPLAGDAECAILCIAIVDGMTSCATCITASGSLLAAKLV